MFILFSERYDVYCDVWRLLDYISIFKIIHTRAYQLSTTLLPWTVDTIYGTAVLPPFPVPRALQVRLCFTLFTFPMNLSVSRRSLVVVFKWCIFIILSQTIYSFHSWDIQVLPIDETTAKRSGTPQPTTTTPTSTVPVSTVVPTKNKNPNQTKEAKSAISDPTCQLLVRNATISSDYEFYRAVHESRFPACAAGTWKYLPDMVVIPSEEHLI